MGFFQQFDVLQTSNDLKFIGMAKQLRDAIVQANTVHIGYSKKAWAKEIQLLNREVDNPDRLALVLNWYCGNINKPFVPRAYCAKTFRRKFLAIEQAMNRQQGELVIFPIAHELAEIVSRYQWPAIIPETVAPSIQKSLNNREELLVKLTPVLAKQKGTLLVVASTARNFLSTPNRFIATWYTQQSERLGNFVDWSGDFKSLHFHKDHKLFVKTIYGISVSHSASTKAAITFLSLIK